MLDGARPMTSKTAMASKYPIAAQPSNGARGSIPVPLMSSAQRWNGVCVELYRVRDIDIVRDVPDHVVTVFLRGSVNLYQHRSGRSWHKTMQAGDIIVAPAGAPRILRHKEETEAVKVMLAPTLVDAIAKTIVPERASQIELMDNFGTRDQHIEELVRRLFAELRGNYPGDRLCAESLATELAVHLIRNYSTVSRTAASSYSMFPRYKLQRVTDYIQDNLREELSLEKIAQTLSMSPYHFAHAFKQAVGLAPHRYVVKCRIDRAKSLLRDTDLSVTEIAHQVGFANQSHFSVAFHKLTGQTPRHYRDEA